MDRNRRQESNDIINDTIDNTVNDIIITTKRLLCFDPLIKKM